MADFATLTLDLNANGTVTQSWKSIGAAGTEARWSDSSAVSLSTAGASWPPMIRPGSVTQVNYLYAFTADTTGHGVYGGADASAPVAFAITQYLQAKWAFGTGGTLASNPIFTAYASGAHAAITRGDGSILGGHTTDTGATARSYMKGNAWGQAAAPGAGPANGPGGADGTTGTTGPTAGANWLGAQTAGYWQSLQGDNDYITAPFQPAASSSWYVMLALFTGPNMTPGTYTPVISLKYTYS